LTPYSILIQQQYFHLRRSGLCARRILSLRHDLGDVALHALEDIHDGWRRGGATYIIPSMSLFG
jgi:hypothetical protein